MTDRLADSVADRLAVATIAVLAAEGWLRTRLGREIQPNEMRECLEAASLQIPALTGIGDENPTGEATIMLDEAEGKRYYAIKVEAA